MRLPVAVAVAIAACAPPSPAARPPVRAAAVPSPRVTATPARNVAGSFGAPLARTVDVRETHFGVTVSDPYRWMEGADNAELQAWLHTEQQRASEYLARLPGRDALHARVRELGAGSSSVGDAQLVKGKLFYFETSPGDQLPRLMVRDAGRPRVLVDPAALQGATGHVSVDGFSPSHDGRKLAFNVTAGGGELAEVHVVEVATGQALPDRAERIWGGLGVAWLPDGSGFFYTQMAPPAAGVDPLLNPHVRLHVLGTPAASDVVVLGSGVSGAATFDPSEFLHVAVPPGSRWLFAQGDGARSEAHYVIAPLAALDRSGAGKTPWRTVADYADEAEEGAVVHGDRVYLLSTRGASNRRIVSVAAANPDLATARVELAEDPRGSMVRLVDARDALYVQKMVDGRARLVRWAWRGEPTEIALPFDGWIDELVADPTRDGVLFREQGWTRPAAYYRYEARKNAVVPEALAVQTDADYREIVAEESEARSSDGTSVPLSILRRRDAPRDGARPTVVYGYGGYGISQTPGFSPTRLAWLERGGVFAVCHVRGGSEKGHAWQLGGVRENKMNGVHDLEACAQALIDARLSSPSHLFA